MKTFLILAGVVVLVLFACVRYIESVSVFHPTTGLSANPSQWGLPFEDIYFLSQDNVRLNGWFVKSPQARTTILYFHGNAGTIADRLDKIKSFHALGVNVFIIDYRGYGLSQGKPSEHGIYADAVAAYDYLLTRSDLAPGSIGVYGASLGGAVAVDLATKRTLAYLIVDSSFSSAGDIGKIMYPYLPTFFMQTKLDSLSKIKRVMIPKLFFHSPHDELIPIRLGRKLFEAAPVPKRFVETNGGHNDNHVIAAELWRKEVSRFLDEFEK